MFFKNTFCRTLAPASRKMRRTLPLLVQDAQAAQRVEKSMATLTPRFSDLQWQLQPLKQRVLNRCGGMVFSGAVGQCARAPSALNPE